jgi:hypothetical protein
MPHHFELTNRSVRESNGVDVDRYDLAGVSATGFYLAWTVFFAAFHS